MSLLKTEANKAPMFESEDETTNPTATKPTMTETPAAPAATSTAVTAPVQTALAKPATMDPLGGFKNAMRVEYNTLESIIATNGNFVSRETKKVLGDTLTFELLSYQDAYVVSPNDDKAPDGLVRYSDDGLTCSDGTSVQEHLDTLRQDWPKAGLKPRVVVVGAIQSTSKPAGMEDALVQFDLSPASRTMWNRYLATTGFKVSKGRMTAEAASIVKATAELATAGTNTYTVALFTVAG